MEFVMKIVENVEKGENAGYQHFLLFPHNFFKSPIHLDYFTDDRNDTFQFYPVLSCSGLCSKTIQYTLALSV